MTNPISNSNIKPFRSPSEEPKPSVLSVISNLYKEAISRDAEIVLRDCKKSCGLKPKDTFNMVSEEDRKCMQWCFLLEKASRMP